MDITLEPATRPQPEATPPKLTSSRGHPLPLGATLTRDGINFAVYSRHATAVSLVLFRSGSSRPLAEIALDSRYHRTGDVWHVLVRGLGKGVEYGWRVDGPPPDGAHPHRFDPGQILVDPYARALNVVAEKSKRPASARRMRRRHSLVVENEFDWGEDQPLNRHLADTIIYELHVRGFTRHPSSGVVHPSSFLGVVEKIPYLRELGVTAVELMPVTEFEEYDNPRCNPFTGKPLVNFWGYHPLTFFAPKASYATRPELGSQVIEFKRMVRELHAAGLEVILDMVFNHTAEGDGRGPTINFRGLDNGVYYIVDPKTGRYHNYSGCGNTLNCNHPIVRDMILDCLRYWVMEMHVDGFRFDLASVLGRGRDGSVLANPPLLERIAADPVLANTKLIAEAWDAAGLYQVGTFPNWGRWAEWNGKFRDDIRRFVKGDPGMTAALATRLAGSADLYQASGREPYHSINFITSHDGFTLADLVSYNRKHNLANGENNRDGHPANFSWNCGHEGPTSSPEIRALRRRQMKNLATLLMLSQGVPMVLYGDEAGRSQDGNNNAYCQDNELTWLDWRLHEENQDLFRFFKLLIQFRKRHASLRRREFFTVSPTRPPEVAWHGTRLTHPDWSDDSKALAMHLLGSTKEGDIYLIANAHREGRTFELPPCSPGRRWHRLVDTLLAPPLDIVEERRASPLPDQQSYQVGPRTVVVLAGR